MTKVFWKWFINYEKEEAWLNEMSAKGLAFTDYFLCRYKFADSAPGEYTVRIELLENVPVHPKSKQYLSFMAESGVELVSTWFRWAYFRKKAEDGPFDIFSDIDSRIAHYKRITMLFFCLGFAEFCIGLGQLIPAMHHLASGTSLDGVSFNLILCCLIWCIGIVLIATGVSFKKKITKLRRDKELWN